MIKDKYCPDWIWLDDDVLAARHPPYLLLSQEVRRDIGLRQQQDNCNISTINAKCVLSWKRFRIIWYEGIGKYHILDLWFQLEHLIITTHQISRYDHNVSTPQSEFSVYIDIGICVSTDPCQPNVLLSSHISYNYYDITVVLLALKYVQST